jgi:signal transduction histidine kinase
MESYVNFERTEAIIDDIVNRTPYLQSDTLDATLRDDLLKLLALSNRYKSEDAIRAGNAINQQELADRIEELYEQSLVEAGLYDQDRDVLQTDPNHSLERFKAENTDQIEELRQEIINRQLNNFRETKASLDEQEGLYYHVSSEGRVLENLPAGADIQKMVGREGVWLNYEKRQARTNLGDRRDQAYSDFIRSFDEVAESDQYSLQLFYSQTFIDKQTRAYNELQKNVWNWLLLALIPALLGLGLMVYLCLTAGRGRRGWLDRRSTEFRLAWLAAAVGFGAFLFMAFAYYGISFVINGAYGRIDWSGGAALSKLAPAALTGLLFGSLALAALLAIARSLRQKRFLADSLVIRLLKLIWKGVTELYHGGSLMRKVIIWGLVLLLAAATRYLAPVVLLAVLAVAPRLVRKYEDIKKGVNEVKSGNLSHKIPVDGKTELDQLADGINRISEATHIAVQNELINQRMKTELISNVSHDLKTPLTGIITYVDLLKKEGLTSPDAEKYLQVLDEKSQRLKKLTEDLFEAAKASSGAIPVELAQVDLLSLVNQGLGEMEAGFNAAGLDVRLNAEIEDCHIMADGRLMWRVIENLLTNVQKYALPGSRVYIDITRAGNRTNAPEEVILSIKNVSQNELNITPNELMERFRRGDEARSSEGSGLGLAIAKDLVRLQKGLFGIKIDGDHADCETAICGTAGLTLPYSLSDCLTAFWIE